MITAGELRKGVTFEKDGKIFRVVDFQHVKPGKGSAFVRTKYKNIVTGQVLEESFNPTEKFQEAKIENREYQYLYSDESFGYFMNLETYDQIQINIEDVKDALDFIIPEMSVAIQSYKGVPFSVEPPNFVELAIAETDPGMQGDTSKAGNKPAKLETGYGIMVPLFINIGDKIRVDTRTGTYMERVK